MKELVTILLFSCSTIILSQTQLDIQGGDSGIDTVAKITQRNGYYYAT